MPLSDMLRCNGFDASPYMHYAFIWSRFEREQVSLQCLVRHVTYPEGGLRERVFPRPFQVHSNFLNFIHSTLPCVVLAATFFILFILTLILRA